MKTYLYAFNMYAWFDKVFILNDADNKISEWDLIQNWEWNYFLVLWEDISFSEVYNTIYSSDKNFRKIYSWLLSQKTIKLIHRMVYERYTTYKNVIKFFLNQEIEKQLLKEVKQNNKNKEYSTNIWKSKIQCNKWEQTLIVFPDMRSFTNIILDNYEWILLYSLDTQNKKDTNWWKIKTWNEQLIYTTSSEIFQDFKNLKNIYLLEPQKWYYAAQQDPRYKVEIVLGKIAELNQANIKIINSEEIF